MSLDSSGVGELNIVQQLFHDITELMRNTRTAWKITMDSRIPEEHVMQYVEQNYGNTAQNLSLAGDSICRGLNDKEGKLILNASFFDRTGELIILGPNIGKHEVMSQRDRIILEVTLIAKLLKEWIPNRDNNPHKREGNPKFLFMEDTFTPAHLNLLERLGIRLTLLCHQGKRVVHLSH